MKKHNCLPLILVLACCNATRAQDETKPAARTQTPIRSPATTQAQPQTHPAQQARLHQPAPRQSRLSFNILGGAAFPTGQFAKTDVYDPKSGPVHTGSLVEFSGTYHLNQTWGINLLANRQHHHSEVDELIVPGPPIPEVSVPGPLTTSTGSAYSTISPQHWTMTRILAGGVYTLPLNPKKTFALLVRALAGIQKTHVPQYEYFLTVQNITGLSSFPPRSLAWAFSYQADAGLQWKVYRRWSVLALAGYNGSRPSYNQDVTGLLLVTGQTNPVYKKIHFPTGSILMRAGLTYRIEKRSR